MSCLAAKGRVHDAAVGVDERRAEAVGGPEGERPAGGSSHGVEGARRGQTESGERSLRPETAGDGEAAAGGGSQREQARRASRVRKIIS